MICQPALKIIRMRLVAFGEIAGVCSGMVW